MRLGSNSGSNKLTSEYTKASRDFTEIFHEKKMKSGNIEIILFVKIKEDTW